MNPKILIVEDDENACQAIQTFFLKRGFITESADNKSQAITIGTTFAPDFLITDWMLKEDGNGVDVAKALKRHNPELVVIFITAYQASGLYQQAKEIGGTVLEKPVKLSNLYQCVLSENHTN